MATKALELIADGSRVGLGSGRAALLFITNLGQRRREGLRVLGVARGMSTRSPSGVVPTRTASSKPFGT